MQITNVIFWGGSFFERNTSANKNFKLPDNSTYDFDATIFSWNWRETWFFWFHVPNHFFVKSSWTKILHFTFKTNTYIFCEHFVVYCWILMSKMKTQTFWFEFSFSKNIWHKFLVLLQFLFFWRWSWGLWCSLVVFFDKESMSQSW